MKIGRIDSNVVENVHNIMFSFKIVIVAGTMTAEYEKHVSNYSGLCGFECTISNVCSSIGDRRKGKKLSLFFVGGHEVVD